MRLQTLALVAATALGAPAAHAASSADASFTGIGFQLIDLNPTDGIAPWISFAAGARTEVSAWVSAPFSSQSGSAARPGVLQTVQTSAAIDNGTAAAQAGPDSLSASGFTEGLLPFETGFGSSTFQASARGASWWSGFTLSPNTLLVITGLGQVQASTTVGLDASFNSESASAQISLSVSGQGIDGGGQQSSSDGLSTYASWTSVWNGQSWGYAGESRSGSDTLSASFLNISGQSITGTLDLNVSLSGHSAVAAPTQAVPEPSTWALMLGGLGLCASLARRRRRA